MKINSKIQDIGNTINIVNDFSQLHWIKTIVKVLVLAVGTIILKYKQSKLLYKKLSIIAKT